MPLIAGPYCEGSKMEKFHFWGFVLKPHEVLQPSLQPFRWIEALCRLVRVWKSKGIESPSPLPSRETTGTRIRDPSGDAAGSPSKIPLRRPDHVSSACFGLFRVLSPPTSRSSKILKRRSSRAYVAPFSEGAIALSVTLSGGALLLVENYSNSRQV